MMEVVLLLEKRMPGAINKEAINRAVLIHLKITKIVDKWFDERDDTDWDTLQGSLMNIYKLVHKK